MAFLNPIALWFAFALAIPIIVHLFNFRKPKRVLFANVAFVKAVNKAVVRRLKLKQWLLLAVRLLALLALVFVFANPVLLRDGVADTATGGSRSVILVIDNSQSMAAADERGKYLQQAKNLAYTLLKSASSADEFQIQTTGNLRFNNTFIPASQAFTRLNEVDFKDKIVTFGQIISGLPQLFETAANRNRQLYFFSDFQKKTVMADSLPNLKIPDDITVHFVPIGGQQQPNIYISDVAFENPIVEKDKPVNLKLQVTNESEKEAENISIKVNVDDKAVAIASVSLNPGEKKVTTVTFTPQRTGWHSGEIRLDDMPNDFDNVRFFSYNIPEKNRILIVSPDKPFTYLNLFFENLVSQYQVKFINYKSLPNVSLTDYTMVCLAGVPELSGGLIEKLKGWLKAGGGLMVFPENEGNNQAYKTLYATLNLGKWGDSYAYPTPSTFQTPDLTSFFFQGVFLKPKENAEFDAPSVLRRINFTPQSDSFIQTAVLKDKSEGLLLQDSKFGEGRVMTFTIAPDLTWSDFPIKSSFAPILYRTTLILNNAAKTTFFYEIGSAGERRIPTNSREIIKLRQANGFEVIPQQYSRTGAINLKFDGADLRKGNYDVLQKDSLLAKISFNLPDKESELAVATSSEITSLLKEKGLGEVKVLKAVPEIFQQTVADAAFGTSLWKYFLMLAVLMLIAEMLIQKLMKV